MGKRRTKRLPGVPIVPGVRVVDTRGPGDDVTGVCIGTDREHVVYRVDGGDMTLGSVNMAPWSCVHVCGEQPPATVANFDADPWLQAIQHPRIARRLAWFAVHIGHLPPHMLLLAALNAWDGLIEECKHASIIDILDLELHEPFGANNAPTREGGAQ